MMINKIVNPQDQVSPDSQPPTATSGGGGSK